MKSYLTLCKSFALLHLANLMLKCFCFGHTMVVVCPYSLFFFFFFFIYAIFTMLISMYYCSARTNLAVTAMQAIVSKHAVGTTSEK